MKARYAGEMSSSSSTKSSGNPKQARRERQAKALKANLARRKAAVRGKAGRGER